MGAQRTVLLSTHNICFGLEIRFFFNYAFLSSGLFCLKLSHLLSPLGFDYYRFDGQTKNYKLYYDGLHYVGEKRFETVEQLVADGLIHFYLESRAADYIASLSDSSNYAQSPYLAYSVKKKRIQKSRRHGVNNTVVNHDLPTNQVDARVPTVRQFNYSQL